MGLPILPVIRRRASLASSKIAKTPPKGYKRQNPSHFKEDMQRLSEDIAEEFKELVIKNIEENTYEYALSEDTIKRKNSETPLIDSHEMVDAIYREGTTVSVEDTPRDDSPLTNLELAIVHEYGTKDLHIPARPVWRETFSDFEDTARDKVQSFLDTGKFKERK